MQMKNQNACGVFPLQTWTLSLALASCVRGPYMAILLSRATVANPVSVDIDG